MGLALLTMPVGGFDVAALQGFEEALDHLSEHQLRRLIEIERL
jgi:hypothetical protein